MKNTYSPSTAGSSPVVFLHKMAAVLVPVIVFALCRPAAGADSTNSTNSGEPSMAIQAAAIDREMRLINGNGPDLTEADIIAYCIEKAGMHSRDVLEMDESYFHTKRERLWQKLLDIFNDKSRSNYSRCAAAYYLGEMRVPEAAEDLAAEITLGLDMEYEGYRIPSEAFMSPASTALVKIGSPALPALVKNLENSEDSSVRMASLVAIYAIDGKDKAITQFRLNRAMNGQSDAKKKARIAASLQILTSNAEFNRAGVTP
jgi:HEAT repeat protein